MTRIHRNVEYGLMALKIMQKRRSDAGLTTAKEISEMTQAPFEVIARVLQKLASHHILEVEMGAKGGYRLAKDLSELSLHQVIEVLNGPVEIAPCLQKGETCDIENSCNIASPMQVLNEKLKHFYSSITVQELVRSR